MSGCAVRSAGENKFEGVSEWQTEHGVPALTDAVAFIECETSGHFVSCDHAILIGNVVRANVNRRSDVLVHYRRQFDRTALPSG